MASDTNSLTVWRFLVCVAPVQTVFFVATFSIAEALQQNYPSLASGRLLKDVREGSRTNTDAVQQTLQQFYSNEELGDALEGFTQRCGAISRLFTIGNSVNGTPLWVLEVSDHPGGSESKPNVKLVGNIHGDESSGRQLLLALAEWLCANYESDHKARRVVEGLRLFLLPSINPDGFEAHSRFNARGVDLNRNFPDPIKDPGMERSASQQPEVLAVMDWSLQQPGGFVASGGLHEGELVANYPWDGSLSGRAVFNATSDEDTFRHLALTYARRNPPMLKSQVFPGGITNGAKWYPIYGGMQDWNYVAADCYEITLELSADKSPPASQLPLLFEYNLHSMLDFALTAALGGEVQGRVFGNASAAESGAGLEPDALLILGPSLGPVDEKQGLTNLEGKDGDLGNLIPLEAEVEVAGSDKVLRSRTPGGAFYRPLHPGLHTLTFSAEGYLPLTLEMEVPKDGSGVEVEVVLEWDD